MVRPSTSDGRGLPSNQQPETDFELAKRKASDLVIEAEKFKAAVNNPPQGMPSVQLQNQNQVVTALNDELMNALRQQQFAQGVATNSIIRSNAGPNLDPDDEFFHVTCHIDQGLRQKIQRGDYVDLEKLLPKSKRVVDNKMDLVFRDGKSFFVPATSESKITGIRRWEQAFRVYAALYSESNPDRAAEIWQYVHIINTAASSYLWENVANYDFTFRQLMAAYPHRSWAKIYNQMWNISMRDPLPRNNYNGHNAGPSGNSSAAAVRSSNQQTKPAANKPKYCWVFNRANVKCKDGPKCKFIHRCSYCDNAGHGKHACTNKN